MLCFPDPWLNAHKLHWTSPEKQWAEWRAQCLNIQREVLHGLTLTGTESEVDDAKTAVDTGTESEVESEVGAPVGLHLPRSHAICCCIFAHDTTGFGSLEVKCKSLLDAVLTAQETAEAHAVPRVEEMGEQKDVALQAPAEAHAVPCVEEIGEKKDVTLQAPAICIVAASFLGLEKTREHARALQQFIESGLLKLYASDREIYLLNHADYAEQINSVLQLGAWHGYDVLEVSSLVQHTHDIEIPRIFGNLVHELKMPEVMFASVKRQALEAEHRKVQENYTGYAEVASWTLDKYFVEENRMIAWAQTWMKIGFLEQSVASLQDIFTLTALACHRFNLPFRTTNFQSDSSEHEWPPCSLPLACGPLESLEDPGGPVSNADGFFEPSDLARFFARVVDSLPTRSCQALTHQRRNNQDKRIGLPLRRIAKDLQPLPLVQNGPVFLVGEGRPQAAHACSAGKFVLESDLRKMTGYNELYSAELNRVQSILKESANKPNRRHNLAEKNEIRVMDPKDRVVFRGTFAQFEQQRGELQEGERLAGSHASRRRIRAKKSFLHRKEREQLQAQITGASSTDVGHRPFRSRLRPRTRSLQPP